MKRLCIVGGVFCCLALPPVAAVLTQSDATDNAPVVRHGTPSLVGNVNDTIAPPIEGPTIAYGLDTTVSPCDDFYEYANGGWRKAVVFPKSWKPHQQLWTHFHESGRKTQARMERVIDSAYRVRNSTNNSALKVIGIFYESCLTADSLEVVLNKRPQKDSTKKDSTRAAQCVQRVLRYLGAASGQIFAEDVVSNSSVQRMKALLASIKAAAHEQLERNTLLSADEIAELQKRLDRLYLRVGIPETKIDYTRLTLSPNAYNANKDAIANFNTISFVSEIGGDAREKWKMSLLTANAFYNQSEHAVEVPPAMFLPPFFDASADDALNFASAGYVIGHEMFHGLATQLGQSANPAVKVEIDSFQARNSELGTVEGWMTSGARTYDEDIADLGGIHVAYNAWKKSIAEDRKAQTRMIDGFTPEQRFFLSFGRVWRAKWTGLTAANNGVHAASFARINGMVMQMPEFATAFGCKSDDRMVLPAEKRSKLW